MVQARALPDMSHLLQARGVQARVLLGKVLAGKEVALLTLARTLSSMR
jgi:hypothetical protein